MLKLLIRFLEWLSVESTMDDLDDVLTTLHSTNAASVKLTHPNHHFIWPDLCLLGRSIQFWMPGTDSIKFQFEIRTKTKPNYYTLELVSLKESLTKATKYILHEDKANIKKMVKGKIY